MRYLNFICIIFTLSALVGSLVSAQETEAERLAREFSTATNLVEGRFFEGEELIFTVQVEKYIIGEVEAIAIASGIAFELESYTEAFDFPIDYDIASQSYDGWYVNEANTFSLPLIELGIKPLIVTTAESIVEIQPQYYTYVDDKLYVQQDVFNSIFGIKHKLNLEKLNVIASSDKRLPFIQRLARLKGSRTYNENSTPSFVNLPRGYEVLSPQILDFRANGLYRDKTSDYSGNYSIQGVRDIGMWATRFSLVGNDINPLNATRLNFSRQSLNGDLFGNTGITKFEFGDVRDVKQASGVSLSESLGVRFTNSPILSGIENNTIVIDGDVPVGWDVELYRNNVLLDQLSEVMEGRYNFTDVQLLFGNNVFEIVSYGPQGQVRRRTIERLVDESTYSEKPFTYEFSITDSSQSLIDSEIDKIRNDNGINVSARGNYFLGNTTSLDFGFRSQLGGDRNSSVANIGINSVLFDKVLFGAYLDTYDSGVTNISSNIRSSILGQSVALRANFNDISESSTVRSSDIAVTVEGDIPIFNNVKLPLSQQARYFKQGNNKTFSYSNNIGFRLGALSVFNALNYEHNEYADGEKDNNLFGNLSAQSNLGSIFLRGGLTYEPSAVEKLRALQASLSWRISDAFSLSANYSKDFAIDNSFNSVNLSYLGPNFTLTSRVGYSDLSGYDIGLSASFSLAGQHQYVNRITQEAQAQSVTGMLAVRVFLDKNLNSIFDKNDIPLPNISVKAIQFYKSATTNNEGIAALTRLPNLKTSDITIDVETLPDAFLKPRIEGVSITTRAGLVDFLDFPVVPASELSGVVNIVSNDDINVGSRIKLDLIDSKGRLVASESTEFDGFYAFNGVMPGNYTLTLNTQSQKRKKLEAYSQSILVPIIPDVITHDVNIPQSKLDIVYLSQISKSKENKYTQLVHKSLTNKLRPYDIEVFRFYSEGEQDHIFFTKFDKNPEEIDAECKKLLNVNVKCTMREIELIN